MEGVLIPIALFVAVAFIVVRLAEITSTWLTRRQLIRSGLGADQAAGILALQDREPDRAGALKWGLVAVAVGVALIIVQFLPYRPDEPIALGMVLLAGGAGLLSFVFATSKRVRVV